MQEAKELLKHIPYCLALLTARRGEEFNAMPVSWMGQVSSEPPLIQVAVKTSRYTYNMIRDTGKFGIVFLDKSQKELVPGFKLKGDDKSKKFASYKIITTPAGLPALDDSLGYCDCSVVTMLTPGDHALFIAEITAAKIIREGESLTLFHYGEDYHYGLK